VDAPKPAMHVEHSGSREQTIGRLSTTEHFDSIQIGLQPNQSRSKTDPMRGL
jgi:hypothetical protein